MNVESINIDLLRDCEDMAYKNVSKVWGEEKSSKIERERIILHYFNAMMRVVISKKPRKLILSKNFNVERSVERGWRDFKSKIIKGGDLMPHLSKGHKNPKNKDELLNEWDVHHFHLGTKYKSNGLVERTGVMLLAVVTEDIFYAIGMYDHGHWENEEIVQIIDRNWPGLQEGKVFNLEAYDLTSKERRAVRKKGGNTLANLGGGRVLAGLATISGYQAEAVRLRDIFVDRIRKTEKEIKNPDCYNKIYEEVLLHIEPKPKTPIKNISIKLTAFVPSSNSIIFYIPELDFSIRVNYESSLSEYYMSRIDD